MSLDKVTLDPGAGGATIAVDTDGDGDQHQYNKMEWGAEGTQTPVDVGAAALPIQDGGNSITVDGTVAVTGVATAANQTTLIGHVDGIEGLLTTMDADTSALAACASGAELQVDIISSALPSGASTAAKQPALGTAGTASTDVLTVQGIAAMTALKVDGSAVTQPVSGTFWQATQPVSGTFWQATQPVSLAATVTTTEAGRGTVIHFQGAIPTTVGGTALASNACKEATVKNLLSNSAIIWVGVTGVSASNGYELNPGEALTLKVSNTNLIYCLSASGTINVCVIATT